MLTRIRPFVHRLLNLPPERGPVPIEVRRPAERIPREQTLRLISWNMQFAGGRRRHFFYDGGKDVSIPAHEIRKNLADIGEFLASHRPDFVLLQEVDRCSRRTGYVDQHAALVEALDAPCDASTPYYRCRYVPSPQHEPLGPMDLHLSVLSKYQIDSAFREPLSLLQEPRIRRLFNLRRAILDVGVQISGGGMLRLFNTHYSAFSKGDGTLNRQVAETLAHLAKHSDYAEWVLAGDLNCLPPGDNSDRLPEKDRSQYPERESPIQAMFNQLTAPVPAHRLAQEARFRTYLPPFAPQPDRVLDYTFCGPHIQIGKLRVLPGTDAWSDHRPLLLEFSLPAREQMSPPLRRGRSGETGPRTGGR